MADATFTALGQSLLAKVDVLAGELAARVRLAERELDVVPPEDLAAVCAEQLRTGWNRSRRRCARSTGRLLAVLPRPDGAAFPSLRGSRFGVSPPYQPLSQSAEALRLARLALAAVPPGTAGVCHYGERPIATVIADNPGTADDLARRVPGGLLELPADDRDALLRTARAWFDADGSTTRAAAAMFCHRNTVRYRLSRVEALTGRSVDRPREAAELLFALEAVALDLTRRHPGDRR
ncbi:PucR family transcriptional regulator [Cryptosporangium arvum]|uniref:PucR C-terminal helix-turn-helix domain-containing protein n=1 Tax=Cryptosporangium arvum DSM 44712 TaxID=927661 RepID=A0A010YRM8_9ACTN|nr:helix-turn-helix domain-containing protein [Cryptosporangium arvum]EXG82865.1 hypothetical protein CryarDRAFT_4067 [Cryptosporangium arvum DSM 44712]